MRVLLVGFGSVGRSVASLLATRRDGLYRSMGLAVRLVGVVDSRGAVVNAAGLDERAVVEAKQRTGSVVSLASGGSVCVEGSDAATLIKEVSADVLVEATPSMLSRPEAGLANLKAGMSSRKHVITVNKAPLALAMPGLVELARHNRVEFRYSGSVGAGTPVLAAARLLLRGDRVDRVRAILNGTTNYILWRMSEGGVEYGTALAEAQKLGYAETDPSTDVDGVDTATKVVILCNAIFPGVRATMSSVRVEGIRGIGRDRIESAAGAGKVVKLIGEIDATGGTPVLSVGAQEVAARGPMDVPRNLNAVQFDLATAGEVALVGRGAGGPETATAVLRDLVDIWNTPGVHA